jgi:hypothetical protein
MPFEGSARKPVQNNSQSWYLHGPMASPVSDLSSEVMPVRGEFRVRMR